MQTNRLSLYVIMQACILLAFACTEDNSLVDPDDRSLLTPLFKVNGRIEFDADAAQLKDSLDNPVIVLAWAAELETINAPIPPDLAMTLKLEPVFPLRFNFEFFDVPAESQTFNNPHYVNGFLPGNRWGTAAILLVNDSDRDGRIDPGLLYRLATSPSDSIDYTKDWIAGFARNHHIEFVANEASLEALRSWIPVESRTWDIGSLQVGYNLMHDRSDRAGCLVESTRIESTHEITIVLGIEHLSETLRLCGAN